MSNTAHCTTGFVERLVGKEQSIQFRRHAWQRNAHLFPRALTLEIPEYWITPKDIDTLFCSVDFPTTNFNMADGNQPLPISSYAPNGFIDRDSVQRLHRSGATIIMRAAQRWNGKLRRLCASIESDFGFPTQANIYLTPAGRKSTPPHWDTHDLFIMQISGKKLWKLFSSSYSFPLDSQRFEPGRFAIGDLSTEITVSAGEVLYLPRGFIHEPVAEEYSIHVSFGVLVSRWADVLRTLVDIIAERQEALRSTIELPNAPFDRNCTDELASRLQSIVDLLKDSDGCAEAVRVHIGSLLTQHCDYWGGSLSDMAAGECIKLHTTLRKPASIFIYTEVMESRLHVRWRRGSFSLPVEGELFAKTVLSGESFSIDKAPRWRAPDECLAFCQSLYDQGLLEKV